MFKDLRINIYEIGNIKNSSTGKQQHKIKIKKRKEHPRFRWNCRCVGQKRLFDNIVNLIARARSTCVNIAKGMLDQNSFSLGGVYLRTWIYFLTCIHNIVSKHKYQFLARKTRFAKTCYTNIIVYVLVRMWNVIAPGTEVSTEVCMLFIVGKIGAQRLKTIKKCQCLIAFII